MIIGIPINHGGYGLNEELLRKLDIIFINYYPKLSIPIFLKISHHNCFNRFMSSVSVIGK